MTETKAYWQEKSLFEMSHDEWESVCDGCAKCCVTQLEDEESKQLVFTDVACELLNDGSCQCVDYHNRSQRVPSCMTMNKTNVTEVAAFAPSSCAYRLLLEGRPLPAWHHLNSGDHNAVHTSGNSVQHKVRFAKDTNPDDIQDYVVEWE